MRTNDWLHTKSEQDPAFIRMLAEESFIADVQEHIAQQMEQRDISRAELARRMGVSRARVTNLLTGNPTLRTIAHVMHVLELQPMFWSRAPISHRPPSERGVILNIDKWHHGEYAAYRKRA